MTPIRDLDAGVDLDVGTMEIVALDGGPDWRCLAPSAARRGRPCYAVNPHEAVTCHACGAARARA